MPSKSERVALGLDFGTESVRALLVDLAGNERGCATAPYRHGQILGSLPGSNTVIPPHHAFQHPMDWLKSARIAIASALRRGGVEVGQIIGVGVDFTSCTMLPALADSTPLCMLPEFAGQPMAWPKLWKHHGALAQADRVNEVARSRNEAFLRRYGGIIGLEWFFPKMLETFDVAPKVWNKAEVWVEAGDWFVWRLVGGPSQTLPRSACQAGYKGMWSAADGFPSLDFLEAVRPGFSRGLRDKMPGRVVAPGTPAGVLCPAASKQLGLRPGIPVSAAIIDAHAGVPGAGADQPGTLVMVMGTSSCHMVNAAEERFVPGVAGVVKDGILPGLFGYETGQAAVGDAFNWWRKVCGARDFKTLDAQAGDLPPGADGVRCLDWFNGCRTPLMDGSLRGQFSGLSLHHGPAHFHRALIEASACGLRWIVELLREHGVPVRRFVATGGLPHHNPLITRIYADTLGESVEIHPSTQGPALGAAILGALAAGPAASGFRSTSAAIRAMARPKSGAGNPGPRVIRPNRKTRAAHDRVYADYRRLAELGAAPPVP